MSHNSLHDRADAALVGGVNSPVRAWRRVGGAPILLKAGKGARVQSTDENWLIDYVQSYGPLLYGHAPEFIAEAAGPILRTGTCFGATTELEIEAAEAIIRLIPCAEQVRFVSSGGEACGAAVRLARGATGRDLIVKCAGCYHGAIDPLLARAGSGVATLALPECAGVPSTVAANTLVVDYNDLDQMEAAFRLHGERIAAVMIEPLAANMGLVRPKDGYLAGIRALTQRYGALLIFDEVISGFRLCSGGAQKYFGVLPDLTCLGKIVGGGVPCGALAGRRDLMQHLAPIGPVYQAGTLSGNPLAMAAGLAMLQRIENDATWLYPHLERLTCRLQLGTERILRKHGVPGHVAWLGSLFTIFLGVQVVQNEQDATASAQSGLFAPFFHGLIRGGVHIPPSPYECGFISAAHTEADIDGTLQVIDLSLAELPMPR